MLEGVEDVADCHDLRRKGYLLGGHAIGIATSI
jgi:hypothetical protein